MHFTNYRIFAVIIAGLVSAALASAQTVGLQWNPSATATRYTVYYGEGSRVYDIDRDVGAATSTSITGLVPRHTYYFAVTASNSSGESGYSNEVSYAVPAEPPDTTLPNVVITSPLNGAQVSRNTTVTIRATASDNVKVTKVEFRVNNSLKCTDSTASFTCAWRVPSARGVTYTLKARAFDGAGNSKLSQTITVKSK